jgi:hypothetical protein
MDAIQNSRSAVMGADIRCQRKRSKVKMFRDVDGKLYPYPKNYNKAVKRAIEQGIPWSTAFQQLEACK